MWDLTGFRGLECRLRVYCSGLRVERKNLVSRLRMQGQTENTITTNWAWVWVYGDC